MPIELPANEVAANNELQNYGYRDGNWPPEAVSVIAFACIRNGFTEAEYEHLISTSPIREALETSKRAGRTWRTLLHRQWEWAEENYEAPKGSKADVQRKALALTERVFLADWGDDKHKTERRMAALAVCGVAVDRGAWTFPVSARFLAVAAGISNSELVGSLRYDLAESGLLEITGTGRQTRQVCLNLDWEPEVSFLLGDKQTYPGKFICTSIGNSLLYRHDVFTKAKGSLGPLAGWILTAEQVYGDIEQATLAAWLSVSKGTISKAVKKLREHGLGPDTTWSDLDAVAASLGVNGYRERLLDKFAPEQAAWSTVVAEMLSKRVQEEAELTARFDRIHQELSEEFSREMEELSRITPFQGDPFEGSAS